MRRNQKGQGMTEYIVLVALIAVVAIAAVRFFGQKTKEGFEKAGQSIGGVTQESQSGAMSGGVKKAAGVVLETIGK